MLNYVPGPHQLPPARRERLGGQTDRNSKTPYDHVRQSGIGDLRQTLARRGALSTHVILTWSSIVLAANYGC